uniref:Uncharacterized protein n=1 Tax=Rhizophora mucronata TaxID=61149 RepID=A0A2P2QUK7_RHIMU
MVNCAFLVSFGSFVFCKLCYFFFGCLLCFGKLCFVKVHKTCATTISF